MALKLKVTLIRSPIGRPQTQKATIRGLGLRNLNRPLILEDTPAIRGMIRKVQHLVKVESGDRRIHDLIASAGKRRGQPIHHPLYEFISASIIGRVIVLANSWDSQEDIGPDDERYLPPEVHATSKETGPNSNITKRQHLVPRTHIARFTPPGSKLVWAFFPKKNQVQEIGAKSANFCASRLWSHVAESGWSKAIEDLFHYFLPDLRKFGHDPIVQNAIGEYWALCRARVKLFEKQPRALNFENSTRIEYTIEASDLAEKKGLGLYSTRGDETRLIASSLICHFIDEDLLGLRAENVQWKLVEMESPVVLTDLWTARIIPVTPTRILVGCKEGRDISDFGKRAEEINTILVDHARNFVISSSEDVVREMQRRRSRPNQ